MIWEQQKSSGRPWILVSEAEGQILGTDSIKTQDFVPPKSWSKLSPLLRFQSTASRKEAERTMCYSSILANTDPISLRTLGELGILSCFHTPWGSPCQSAKVFLSAERPQPWSSGAPAVPGKCWSCIHIIFASQVDFCKAILAQDPQGGLTSRDIQPKCL